MRSRALFCLLGIVAAVTLLRAQNPPRQGQAPTFTASTDIVMVDVSVRKGGQQLTGLTAADFDLRDNGVKQDVETVESQAVPIDLSILIDVSGNPDRPWLDLPHQADVAADVLQRARQLTRLLRPGDRVRLYGLSTYIQQLWPLQPAGDAPAFQRIDFDGMPSLYDSLLTLLLQPVEPKRRHVIVAETKGLDSVSVATAADVRQVTTHSDAQAHFVTMEKLADEEVTVRVFQCMYMDLCRPSYRFWVPARRRLFPAVPIVEGAAPLHLLTADGRLLKEGAESTGGGLYQGEGFAEPTLFNTFEKAFENFRQSYILRYTPKGVARAGWHQITVTVPREKSAQIKARNGYSVDAPVAAPPPPAPPLPTGNTLLRTAAEVTRAYETGSYDLVTRSLRQLPDPSRFLDDFEATPAPWPALPRREFALALEIAEAGLFAPQARTRDKGEDMLRRYAQLVRDPISPDAFEREWLVAAARMLEGTLRPVFAEQFIEDALLRFNDPRLLLARAIVNDQRWPFSGTVGENATLTRTSATREHEAIVNAQYQAATAFPEVRAEALLRHAWFLHRIGREADALLKMESATVDPADRSLTYVRELMMGQVFLATDRLADATSAFKRAVALAPAAQEGRVALMNALLLAGDRDQAATLAVQLQSTPATVIDPWWMYWQGEYRRYPDSLERVRGMIR